MYPLYCASKQRTLFFRLRFIVSERIRFEKFGLAAADEVHDFAQRIGEFGEVFFVKKNLVPVVNAVTVGRRHLAAFGNRKKVIVCASRTHVEKIGSTACFDRFGQNLFAVLFLFTAGCRVV